MSSFPIASIEGFLRPWMEWMFGIETGPGEGTVWSLEHSWGWAPWITLLFIVFAEAFLVAVYLRESRQASKPFRMFLAQIRLLLMAIVLFMLAQYALSLERTGLPYVIALVDDTLSMTTVDRYEEELRGKLAPRVEGAGFDTLSRWNLARTLLVEREGALPQALRSTHKLRRDRSILCQRGGGVSFPAARYRARRLRICSAGCSRPADSASVKACSAARAASW